MIKIYKREVPGTLMSELFVVDMEREYASGRMTGLQVEGDQIVWKEKEYERGGVLPFKPFIVADELIIRNIIAAFADLADKNGIEKPSEAKNAGELIATKAHLSDLQTLLKLKIPLKK